MKAIIKEYIKNCKRKTFQWGSFDCYTFIFDLLQNIYPDNKLPNIKSLYKNKEEAIAIQKKYSWKDELQKHFDIKIYNTINQISDREQNIVLCIIENKEFDCIHLISDKYLYSPSDKDFFVRLPLKVLYLLKPKFYFIEIIQPRKLYS